jgi:hypothetical protein
MHKVFSNLLGTAGVHTQPTETLLPVSGGGLWPAFHRRHACAHEPRSKRVRWIRLAGDWQETCLSRNLEILGAIRKCPADLVTHDVVCLAIVFRTL